MSKLTNLLSENNISIDKIIQKGESHLNDEKNSTPVVMITYPVRIKEINSFIEKLIESELISLKPVYVPVLEEG